MTCNIMTKKQMNPKESPGKMNELWVKSKC